MTVSGSPSLFRSRILRGVAEHISGINLPPVTAPSKLEVAQMRALQELRTPEGIDLARQLGHDGAFRMWWNYAREVRAAQPSIVRGWASTGAMLGSYAATVVASTAAKAAHSRPRPYQMSSGIELALRAEPLGSSFPSSHAAVSRAAAESLAAFSDSRMAAELIADANRVGMSRIYAGAHFPSDVAAGADLGGSIARRISGATLRALARIHQ